MPWAATGVVVDETSVVVGVVGDSVSGDVMAPAAAAEDVVFEAEGTPPAGMGPREATTAARFAFFAAFLSTLTASVAASGAAGCFFEGGPCFRGDVDKGIGTAGVMKEELDKVAEAGQLVERICVVGVSSDQPGICDLPKSNSCQIGKYELHEIKYEFPKEKYGIKLGMVREKTHLLLCLDVGGRTSATFPLLAPTLVFVVVEGDVVVKLSSLAGGTRKPIVTR